MAAKQFTAAEWKKINATLKEDPVKFGLPSRIYGSVVLGSFNIRKLGSARKRNVETWQFLADTCRHFDLLAIQEILDDLSGLRRLMELLGPDFGLIISDATGSFPGGKGLAERFGFVYNRRLVERTEVATDITYDRTEVIKTLVSNGDEIFKVMKRQGQYLKAVKAWKEGGKRGRKPKEPKKSEMRLPVFITFIRQPFCVGFRIKGHPGTDPYEFMAVDAHLNYGDPKHDPIQEFHALTDWIFARVGQKKAYHPYFILLGDLNMDFDKPRKDKKRLMEQIKVLNQKTGGITVNFPFLNKHPGRRGVFRTNARLSQTYDQIGLFFQGECWLPSFEINKTKMGKNPTGPDFGVFNFTELFAAALNIDKSDRKQFVKRFEHKVSDHMPLWLRLPLP